MGLNPTRKNFQFLSIQNFKQGNSKNNMHTGIAGGTKQNLSPIFISYITVCDVDKGKYQDLS